eukprot:1593258-Heterocapsa_arctica.AAC.1
MKTDPPHDPSGKLAPMTAGETVRSMRLQTIEEAIEDVNNFHETDPLFPGYYSTYQYSPVMNSDQFTLSNRNTIGNIISPKNWASDMTTLARTPNISGPLS